jgi:hypothetical protein
MSKQLKSNCVWVRKLRKSLLLAISALTAAVVVGTSTALYAQESPDDLAALWIEAIKAHSTSKIMPLIHPGCSKENIQNAILERMTDGDLPAEVTIITTMLGNKAALEKVYEIIPDMQLNLQYVTHSKEDRAKFGIGKGFPISLLNSKWFFVICTKPNVVKP